MRKRLGSFLLVAMAAAAVMVFGSVAQASQNGDSIAIAFARDEPPGTGSQLACTDVAGVPAVATANWNNVFGASDSFSGLVRDTNGVATTTAASVTWNTTNTWSSTGRGEENNNFVPGGPDATLMTGYLDQNAKNITTTVTIFDVPGDITTYDVYVYMLGGIAGKGGEYTVNGVTQSGTVGGAGFNGDQGYVQDPGADHTTRGNYLWFPGLSGSEIDISVVNTFVAPGSPGDPRAVVNAVEIVNTSGG